jgi:hypothetical protein
MPSDIVLETLPDGEVVYCAGASRMTREQVKKAIANAYKGRDQISADRLQRVLVAMGEEVPKTRKALEKKIGELQAMLATIDAKPEDVPITGTSHGENGPPHSDAPELAGYFPKDRMFLKVLRDVNLNTIEDLVLFTDAQKRNGLGPLEAFTAIEGIGPARAAKLVALLKPAPVEVQPEAK